MHIQNVNKNSANGTATVGSGVAKIAKDGQGSRVVFKSTDGVVLRGTILRLDRFRVVFEAYLARETFQVSQVFSDFQVWVEGGLIYSGQAVVCNFLDLGSVFACEVKLDQPAVAEAITLAPTRAGMEVAEAYRSFFNRWQRQVKVLPGFKAVVSDLQSYLSGLKLVLEQVEAAIAASPQLNRSEMELQVAKDLSTPILASIDNLRERLLETAERIAPEQRSAHEGIIRSQLHPLFLCAPFAFRAYQKPLGYAGDYEMMNMIHRNTFEGDSLYAKLVHYWLVNQYPAISVRNRVAHMRAKLVQETIRLHGKKRPVRILNIGCGPAREVGQFIADCHFADQAEFTLVDFDRETLNYVSTSLHEAKVRHARKTAITAVQMSATRLLKGIPGHSHPAFSKPFDMVYCGGLFDYFSDETCKQLVETYYQLLTPGGLAVVANMDDRVPYKYLQEYLLDWHLIYRDDRRMTALVPDAVQRSDWKLVVEQMGVNLFLELRKPDRD